VKPVDRCEQVRGALDERDERAHGEGNPALREVAADPVEGRQQAEFLVDEPREPLARDLRALVGRWERAGCRSPPARAATASRALHDAPPLVLLDDVELLFDDAVHHVERRAAAVHAGFGRECVRLDVEMPRQGVAARPLRRSLRARLLCGLHRRLWSRLERLHRLVGEHGRRSRWPGWRRLSLLARGDDHQLRDAVVEARHLLHELPNRSLALHEQLAQAGVLLEQLGDLDHAAKRSRRSGGVDPLSTDAVRSAAIPAPSRGCEVDAGEQRREHRAVDLNLGLPDVERRQLKAARLETLRQHTPARAVEPNRLGDAPTLVHEQIEVTVDRIEA